MLNAGQGFQAGDEMGDSGTITWHAAPRNRFHAK